MNIPIAHTHGSNAKPVLPGAGLIGEKSLHSSSEDDSMGKTISDLKLIAKRPLGNAVASWCGDTPGQRFETNAWIHDNEIAGVCADDQVSTL